MEDHLTSEDRLSGDEVLVPDRAHWRAWLSVQYAAAPGAWLVLTRKGGNVTTLTYEEAVLEALCYGWIDGQAHTRDDESTVIRFAPIGPRTNWSLANVERVALLEREDLLMKPGIAAVEAAKADGRWPSQVPQ